MKKTLSLQYLQKHLGGKLWEKGTMSRIYLKEGYNTKKMRTNVYVYKNSTGDFAVYCDIECDSQHSNWIASQEKEIVDQLTEKIADIVSEYGEEMLEVSSEPVDVIVNSAILEAQPVKGYFLEWRSVRTPINRFGKLAIRNRQFVVSFSGDKNSAPRGLVELSEQAYEFLRNVRNGEEMLEPYTAVPDYEAIAERRKEAANN